MLQDREGGDGLTKLTKDHKVSSGRSPPTFHQAGHKSEGEERRGKEKRRKRRWVPSQPFTKPQKPEGGCCKERRKKERRGVEKEGEEKIRRQPFTKPQKQREVQLFRV